MDKIEEAKEKELDDTDYTFVEEDIEPTVEGDTDEDK
jgi:hypothetical protein